MILNIVNLNGGGNQTGTVFESISAKLGLKFLFHGACGVEKVMLVYGQKGIGLPLIHSLPHHLLSLLPEILRLSLPLFFLCFEVLFLGVVCLIKKHLQLFLVQG